jgi:hypothetical protein
VTSETDQVLEAVRTFVDEVRTTCLWYLRKDYYPATVDQALSVLDAVERHGDLAAYRRAGELRTWLSRPTSERSAGS